MRIEIKSAANFLVDLARLNNGGLNEEQLERFKENVTSILLRHYTDHWFPDRPFKGSGYRCIRINGTLDPLIARAGYMMGLAMSFLRSLFPKELTMWVDPQEVAYRIGENGSICVLYEELPPPRSATPEAKSPVKVLPPPPPQATSPALQQATSPPALQQSLHHHHYSPSKSMISSSPLQHSPPLSPVTTTQQQQHQQQMLQLSMFFMGGGGKDAGSLVKCKESLRSGLEPRQLHMGDRLFVSS